MIDLRMKKALSLVRIRPSAHPRYRELPLLGRYLDDFVLWACARGYTISSIYLQLDSVRHLDAWLRRRRRISAQGLTADDLVAARHYLSAPSRDRRYAGGLRGVEAFLAEQGYLKPGRSKPL